MMSKEELEVWIKILGTKMHSFTDNSKTYIIFYDESGPTCTCMDFIIRRGSHQYEMKEDGKRVKFQSCKHVAQQIANSGTEIWEAGWGSLKRKIDPQKDP